MSAVAVGIVGYLNFENTKVVRMIVENGIETETGAGVGTGIETEAGIEVVEGVGEVAGAVVGWKQAAGVVVGVEVIVGRGVGVVIEVEKESVGRVVVG